MNDDEMNDRRDGFMIAIGLLLENTEPAVRTEILKTLETFGNDLYLQLNNQSYAAAAAAEGVNPCTIGWHWDHVSLTCVPDE